MLTRIIGLFVLNFLLGNLLAMLEFPVTAVFLTVAFGIIAPLIALETGEEDALQGNTILILIFPLIFAGIVPALTTGYAGLGLRTTEISVGVIDQHRFSSMYRFTDARVYSSFSGHADIYGRRYKVGDVYVAPVAPLGWTSVMPVKAWASSKRSNDTNWNRTCNAAVRLTENEAARKAILQAVNDRGMKTGPDAVLLEWTCNPERTWLLEKYTKIILLAFFMLMHGLVSIIVYFYTARKKK